MSIDLIKSLAQDNEIFTFSHALKKTGMNRDTLKVILSRLERRGLIERIEKGKYLIIPLDSSHGKYTLHEFVIGSWLVEPYAIGYWSALHFYGFTEQIPQTVFIQTTTRKMKNDIHVFGVKYRIVKIKEEKFYGLHKEWIEKTSVMITDREKTIIDCLDKPHYAGGIGEIYKAFQNHNLDVGKISEYAVKIGNNGVIRRLGFFFDQFGIKNKLPRPTTNYYLLLDPTMPPTGKNNSKWRLQINIEKEYFE